MDPVIAYFEATASKSHLFVFNVNRKCHTEIAFLSGLPRTNARFLRRHKFEVSKFEFKRLFFKHLGGGYENVGTQRYGKFPNVSLAFIL